MVSKSEHATAQIINHLIDIGKLWLNLDYHLRQQAIAFAAKEFGLSAPNFELALDWIFSQWNKENILLLIKQNPFDLIANAIQILAGNTPAVIAQAFLQAAILNVPQLIKSPVRCTQFPKLLLQSFAEISTSLSQLFYLDSWENNLEHFQRKLSEADLVIAYGSDQTISAIQNHLSPTTKFVAHGHAGSAAIIFKEAANIASLQQLAWDMLSYDQRGCLSPRVTFVEKGGELAPAACAEIFAHEILPPLATQLYRGELFPGEAAAILQSRILYGFRGKVYSGSDWTVTYDEKLIWPEQALPRFMPFKSFNSIMELQTACRPVHSYLICIGFAGNPSHIAAFNQGSNRLSCPLGTMQKQLLFW